MITPLVMLALMTAPFLTACVVGVLSRRQYDLRAAAAIGLGMLFTFTGIGHFSQTDAMAQMLPAFVPARIPLIYVTGLLELAVAIAFFVPRLRTFAGMAAAAMLIAFFPANIYAAWAHVPMGGHEWGLVYLVIRMPLQLAILLWTFQFTIRPVLASRSPRPVAGWTCCAAGPPAMIEALAEEAPRNGLRREDLHAGAFFTPEQPLEANAREHA